MLLATMVAPAVALAQPADVAATTDATTDAPPAPPAAIGYGAAPGGISSPGAATLPKGTFAVGTLAGFGRRTGLLSDAHKLDRGLGDIALAYAPHELLTIGLSLDGRYDKNFGVGAKPDDGYVGDPHLFVRAIKPSGNLHFGGQLGLWVPGKDAPSIAGSAISVDVRALVGVKAGPGLLSISAGYRLDNSVKSAKPATLSLADRVSLGVSEFSAVIASADLSIPSGKLFYGAEASADIFVGDGLTPMGATSAHSAPGPIIRGGVRAGYHLTPEWAALVFVQGAKVPSISATDVMNNDIKVIAYEPLFTIGIGLNGTFGGPSHGGGGGGITTHPPVDIEVAENADISGIVVDDSGKPVVGAKVEIKGHVNTGTAVTDEKGAFTVTKLPIGKTVKGVTTLDDAGVEVSVTLDGKKPATSTKTLAKGANDMGKITLESALPAGELKGVVRSAVTGKPLVGAKITVEPGGKAATSGADGQFEVELQPGSYKIKVSSPNLADQELEVTIDPNGVAIKNIELHK